MHGFIIISVTQSLLWCSHRIDGIRKLGTVFDPRFQLKQKISANEQISDPPICEFLNEKSGISRKKRHDLPTYRINICHIAIFDTACPGLLRNAVKILAHKNEAEQKFSRPIRADQTKAYSMA